MSRFLKLVLLCIPLALCAASGHSAPPAAHTQVVFAPFLGANHLPEMQVANSDGGNIRAVLPPALEQHVLSLAVDPRDQTIYYGGWAPDYEIGRVKIDGTGKSTLYRLTALDPLVFNRSNSTPTPFGISLDTVHNKVYWVGGQNNTNGFAPDIPTFIQRANLDGTNVETVRQTLWSVSSPYSLVVNGALGKMYWTDMSDFSIRSSNLDGSGMQTVLQRGTATSEQFPWLLGGLAIDFQHQIMFWSELSPNHRNTNIMSAELDGSGVHSVLTVNNAVPNWFDMPIVIGMAVDPATSQLYFANSYTHFPSAGGAFGSVHKVNYDGSNFRTLIASTPRPFSIGLLTVPEPSSVALALWALGAFTFVMLTKTVARYSRSARAPAR